jgi:hypothetical protein
LNRPLRFSLGRRLPSVRPFLLIPAHSRVRNPNGLLPANYFLGTLLLLGLHRASISIEPPTAPIGRTVEGDAR